MLEGFESTANLVQTDDGSCCLTRPRETPVGHEGRPQQQLQFPAEITSIPLQTIIELMVPEEEEMGSAVG